MFPDKLQDETKAAMERSFPEMVTCILTREVRWQYSNIFFLNFGGLMSLFKVLDDASLHDEAVRRFDAWLENTSNDGFHEYNSPAYSTVTLFGLEAAWTYTPDAAFRARLERALEDHELSTGGEPVSQWIFGRSPVARSIHST